MCRQYRGLSQKVMARRLGVDPGTLAKWEREEGAQDGEFLQRLEQVLLEEG